MKMLANLLVLLLISGLNSATLGGETLISTLSKVLDQSTQIKSLIQSALEKNDDAAELKDRVTNLETLVETLSNDKEKLTVENTNSLWNQLLINTNEVRDLVKTTHIMREQSTTQLAVNEEFQNNLNQLKTQLEEEKLTVNATFNIIALGYDLQRNETGEKFDKQQEEIEELKKDNIELNEALSNIQSLYDLQANKTEELTEELNNKNDRLQEVVDRLTSEMSVVQKNVTLFNVELDGKKVLTGQELAEIIEVGDCVTRGQDWKWDDQDGTPGSKGNVTSVGGTDGWWRVKWSNGKANNYRMGISQKYDLAKCSW